MKPLDILKQYWGYENFRSVQEDIIQGIIENQNVLALLPTGGGKSLCYQIPGIYLDGICIVISPLIALMKDQVSGLNRRGIKAISIHSGMYKDEIDRLLDNCVHGDIKFLYVSPERLKTEIFLSRFKRMKISLVAVDEAHCISQWGYDFRPAYLEISELRAIKPDLKMLALTATATEKVKTDIIEKLELKDPIKIQSSFFRKNLIFSVIPSQDKYKMLLRVLKGVEGSSIVYLRSRLGTKDIAEFLVQSGIKAAYYHAGLNMEQRAQVQRRWTQNGIRVMVATNAFGMGIDKPDVRSVIHWAPPSSLEEYIQESGRAGRDGIKSYAVLLYNESDYEKIEEYYQRSFPELDEIKTIYKRLGVYLNIAVGSGFEEQFAFDINAFAKKYEMDVFKVFSSLKILEQDEWLYLSESIYNPSRIMILEDRIGVEEYQKIHRDYNTLLKVILRMYEGLFLSEVVIHEKDICAKSGLDEAYLLKLLNKMAKDGILRYVPTQELPYIHFLKERVRTNDLSINQRMYQFRKRMYLEKKNAIKDYINSTDCRQMKLLEYLGEDLDGPCGKCDSCKGSHSDEGTASEFDLIKNQVMDLLDMRALSVNGLTEHFPMNKKKKLIKLIQHLIDENKIETKEGKLYLLK